MRHLLIDTDTASDDAVALIMALRHPGVSIEAITVVAGNVPVDQGVQNALYTVALCGRGVPVYRGVAKPLVRPLFTAQFIHGQDGLGDIGLPLEGRAPKAGNAVDKIVEVTHKFAGTIEWITLGPLTNIALALAKNPELAGMVKQCTVMGGIAQGHGNVTPLSEYNIWADPEAAQIVLQSGLRIRVVGWDISRTYAWFDARDAAAIRGIGTPLAHFAIDIQNKFKEKETKAAARSGFDLPDPIAMSIALKPDIATDVRSHYVEVLLHEGPSRGQLMIDPTGSLNKTPNAEVVFHADRQGFLELLVDSLRE